MKRFFIHWFILSIALVIAEHLVSGIECNSWQALLTASFVLTALNTFIRPILVLFALPLLVLTLGLFYFVLNAILLYFTGTVLQGHGFEVHGFWSALGGSLIISLVSTILGSFGNDKKRVIIRRGTEAPQRTNPANPPPGKGPVIDI